MKVYRAHSCWKLANNYTCKERCKSENSTGNSTAYRILSAMGDRDERRHRVHGMIQIAEPGWCAKKVWLFLFCCSSSLRHHHPSNDPFLLFYTHPVQHLFSRIPLFASSSGLITIIKILSSLGFNYNYAGTYPRRRDTHNGRKAPSLIILLFISVGWINYHHEIMVYENTN